MGSSSTKGEMRSVNFWIKNLESLFSPLMKSSVYCYLLVSDFFQYVKMRLYWLFICLGCCSKHNWAESLSIKLYHSLRLYKPIFLCRLTHLPHESWCWLYSFCYLVLKYLSYIINETSRFFTSLRMCHMWCRKDWT